MTWDVSVLNKQHEKKLQFMVTRHIATSDRIGQTDNVKVIASGIIQHVADQKYIRCHPFLLRGTGQSALEVKEE